MLLLVFWSIEAWNWQSPRNVDSYVHYIYIYKRTLSENVISSAKDIEHFNQVIHINSSVYDYEEEMER